MEDNPYGEYGASRSEADWRSRSREGIAERWSHTHNDHRPYRDQSHRDWDERRSFQAPDDMSGPRRPRRGWRDEYGADDREAYAGVNGDYRRGGGPADRVGNANRQYFDRGYPEYEAGDTPSYREAYRDGGRAYGYRGDGAYADSHRGKGPKGYRRSDERIREDVNDRLTEDHHLDASDIEVAVANGEVTLNGFVDSRHGKRHAEDLADRCSGVSHVQNNLRVRPRETRQATTNGTAGAGENLILDRVADGKSRLQPD